LGVTLSGTPVQPMPPLAKSEPVATFQFGDITDSDWRIEKGEGVGDEAVRELKKSLKRTPRLSADVKGGRSKGLRRGPG